WIPTTGAYEGKSFVSITHGAADLSAFAADAGADAETDGADGKVDAGAGATDPGELIAWLKTRFDQDVADIRPTDRLADSPACFVASESSMDMQLSKILKASGQDAGAAQRVLEINPRHPLVASLATEISSAPGSTRAEQVADLLFDMALVVEGEAPRNPGTFAKSLTQVLDGALKS
ncbi:MAG: molecular chaperone HtpG, partial [Pseudomonadota bacterium]|nr:molecular chaperone HtpG [Pseudomonadota bacterium]